MPSTKTANPRRDGKQPPQAVAEEGALPQADRVSAARQVERLYRVQNPDAVRAYLHRHPDLVDALIEAANVIPRFVPTSFPLELEVIVDPDDDARDLFAVVPTELEPEEIRPLLTRLRREWLIGVAQQLDEGFNVGVKYV